jgi:hypothetical protein
LCSQRRLLSLAEARPHPPRAGLARDCRATRCRVMRKWLSGDGARASSWTIDADRSWRPASRRSRSLALNLRGASDHGGQDARPRSPGRDSLMSPRQMAVWQHSPVRVSKLPSCSTRLSRVATKTSNKIRANSRLRKRDQRYSSAAASEATRWGVSVQLLHLVRNCWQCDIRTVFACRERFPLEHAIQILKRDTRRLHLSNRAELVFDSLPEIAATETCCDFHALCVTLPVCDRDMGPGHDQHL